jgi:hypothetical protein
MTTRAETISREIRAALDLANDTYEAGYRQGVLAGKREAYAEIQEILNRPAPAPDAPDPGSHLAKGAYPDGDTPALVSDGPGGTITLTPPRTG